MLKIRQVHETLRVCAGSKVLFGDATMKLGLLLNMDQIELLLATQRDKRPAFPSTLYELDRVDPALPQGADRGLARGVS
jgi:hypothetical protein